MTHGSAVWFWLANTGTADGPLLYGAPGTQEGMPSIVLVLMGKGGRQAKGNGGQRDKGDIKTRGA